MGLFNRVNTEVHELVADAVAFGRNEVDVAAEDFRRAESKLAEVVQSQHGALTTQVNVISAELGRLVSEFGHLLGGNHNA